LNSAGEGMGVTGHRKSYAARTAQAGLHGIAFRSFSLYCTPDSYIEGVCLALRFAEYRGTRDALFSEQATTAAAASAAATTAVPSSCGRSNASVNELVFLTLRQQ
jgi:hypothetical protein